MFLRRNPLTFAQRARILLFPPGGWRRTARYLWQRLVRLPGSPEFVACGMAWGVAISFTPLWGGHFALSMGLSWLTRGSMIAAAIGTLFGNPWTFPIIVAACYQVGLFCLPAGMEVPIINLANPGEAWAVLIAHPFEVFLPLIVGSVPLGALGWLVTFWLVRRAVAEYHRRRHARRDHAPRAGPSGSPTVAE